jgi:hypothetical protein
MNTDKTETSKPILASNLVAKDGMKVCWMFREEPDHDLDSGWRVFSGTEDQDYADDPKHLAWYNASTILEIDPDIGEILIQPVGSAFERKNPNEKFEEVKDWEEND